MSVLTIKYIYDESLCILDANSINIRDPKRCKFPGSMDMSDLCVYTNSKPVRLSMPPIRFANITEGM